MTHNLMDARDLDELARRIGLPGINLSTENDDELDAAALALRQAWFERAHKPADTTLKSPCAGATVPMPGGNTLRFGYERDLDVSLLEERGAPDYPTPDGWTSSRVVCRSGQSTLSCLLHFITSMGEPPFPSRCTMRAAISKARPSSRSGHHRSFARCRRRYRRSMFCWGSRFSATAVSG